MKTVAGRGHWLSALLLCAGGVQADLLPPLSDFYRERHPSRVSNPLDYDLADPYCRGKPVSERCLVPANAPQPTGEGICGIRPHATSDNRLALCVVHGQVNSACLDGDDAKCGLQPSRPPVPKSPLRRWFERWW